MSAKKTRENSVSSCCGEALNFFAPNRSPDKLYLRYAALFFPLRLRIPGFSAHGNPRLHRPSVPNQRRAKARSYQQVFHTDRVPLGFTFERVGGWISLTTGCGHGRCQRHAHGRRAPPAAAKWARRAAADNRADGHGGWDGSGAVRVNRSSRGAAEKDRVWDRAANADGAIWPRAARRVLKRWGGPVRLGVSR